MGSGIPVFLFLFLAGVLLEANRQLKTFPLIPENDSINTFIASVNEPPVNSGASQKVFLTLKYRHDRDSWEPLTGNVLGYFRNGKSGTVISLGDFIVFRTRIERMTDNSNPGTFSYVDYLHKKGSALVLCCSRMEKTQYGTDNLFAKSEFTSVTGFLSFFGKII